ncbi:hypothetical protein PUN28_017767 [Cardiocondyla obscurior]|uniref:Uncharacterized protein n=1 Tax=Cardiocondyla obscurior TaxID=286306 RepID=A0AAW2ENT7_9HYME
MLRKYDPTKPTATWHVDNLHESSDEYNDDPTEATYENICRPDRQTRTSAHTNIRTANGKNFMLIITDQGFDPDNPEASGSAFPLWENIEEEEQNVYKRLRTFQNIINKFKKVRKSFFLIGSSHLLPEFL